MTGFIHDFQDAFICFDKQLLSVNQPHFIHEFHEFLLGLLLEIPAESRFLHMRDFGRGCQVYFLLEVFGHVKDHIIDDFLF